MELRTIVPENVEEACRITLRPGQERYVAPVSYSLAQAYADPEAAWPRLVYEGDEVVAFVMGGFKDGDPLLHSTIWRLNVASHAQGVDTVGSASGPWPKKRRGEGEASCIRPTFLAKDRRRRSISDSVSAPRVAQSKAFTRRSLM